MLRLTLRTLLAYLDDTLSPTEARDIGHQIAQEASLKDLISRIKSVMRRRRLMADSPDPDTAKLDANDVAEYLDSMLPPARVVELEKRLLENDQDLAEVASVHQILSLVLGKPAEISASARQQAYRLVARTRTHTHLDPIGPKRNETTRHPERADTIAPMPLGESGVPSSALRNRIGMSAIVAALLFSLALMLYVTLTPPKSTSTTRKQGPKDAVATAAASAEPTAAATAKSSDEPSDKPAAAKDSSSTPASGVPKAADAADTPAPPTPAPERSPPSSTDDTGKAEEPKSPPLPVDRLDELAPLDPGEESTVKPSSPDEKASPAEPPPAPPVEIAKSDTTPAAPSKERESPDLDRVVPVATYTSPTGILFRRSGDKWSRIQSQDQIYARDRLAIPRPERAKIELPAGNCVVVLYGPTRAEALFEPGADITIDLIDGRAVFTTGDQPATVMLKSANRTWTLATDGKPAMFATEARLMEWPTATAPTRKPVRAIDVFVVSGNLEAASGDAESAIPAGNQVVLGEGPGPISKTTIANEPAWIEEKAESSVARASLKMSDEISYGSGPESRYRELISPNSAATRQLAMSAITVLGDLDTLASALKHDRSDVRTMAIEALRSFARQGGESLSATQSAVRRGYSEAVAKNLNELILGYRREDCTDAAIRRRLVDFLKSEDVEVREAAIHNLRGATGETYGYSAGESAVQRKKPMQRWESWVANAKIDSSVEGAPEKKLLTPGTE